MIQPEVVGTREVSVVGCYLADREVLVQGTQGRWCWLTDLGPLLHLGVE